MSNLKPKSLIILIGISLIMLVITSCQVPSAGLERQSMKTEVKKPANPKERKEKLATDQQPQSKMKDRKIIKKANLSLEQKDFTGLYEKIKRLVQKHEGYITNSRQWQNNNQQKHSSYKLRIPQQNFESIITELKDLGKLKNEQLTGRDITKEYIDLEARLNNFKAQEKRYLELLSQAEDVEDILKIEKELNQVRIKIEQLQGKVKYYDNRLDLATINVNISQPPSIINNNWQVINSFKEAVKSFLKSINLIIILIGTLLPWFFFVILLGIIGYFIFKKIKK